MALKTITPIKKLKVKEFTVKQKEENKIASTQTQLKNSTEKID